MLRKLIATGALIVAMTAPALADPIEGNWKTKSGETAAISKCGGSFCVKLTTGDYSGKSIGKMKGANGDYSGTITDPKKDKTYSGSASISGKTMKMKGCVLGFLCRSENWSKL
ncbi:hypothetical protein IMCC20628_01089 [Hoeflea sp. IMCC20628]|uniref:DUF2147 domain-containing protein n=1 Tax=Hoeflea sp. IMCC20628 TaxID=1620421 RepID=UPI00063ADE10|nr:DUF2147 domain-containing protein [Hoeflea sp. IMCC20628]AKH99806.1 hypothetical protein IMCC20628_01089 [Hoeflea sp. IMCC20628]